MIYDEWLKWSKFREPLLKALAQGYGSHTEDDVLVRIAAGDYKLWTWESAALVTYFVDYPRFKALNMFIYGGDLKELASKQAEVEAYAVRSGAKRCLAGGRVGWERVFPDYKKHAVMYYKDI